MRLKDLNVASNGLRGEAALYRLALMSPGLEELEIGNFDVGERNEFSGSDLWPLQLAENLRVLGLSRLDLDDSDMEGVAALKQVEEFHLDGNDITSRGYVTLAAMPNLKCIVAYRAARLPGFDEFRRLRPNVEITSFRCGEGLDD